MKLRPEKCLLDWEGCARRRIITVNFETTVVHGEYSGSFKMGDLVAYFRCRRLWAERGHYRLHAVELYRDDYYVKTVPMMIQRVSHHLKAGRDHHSEVTCYKRR